MQLAHRVVVSLCCVFALCSVSAAMADERAADVEAFMEEYLRLWNAGDSATITAKMMRFDGPHPFATQAGLQAEFDRLKASGYSHSKNLGIKGCWISATQALVELRYSRVKVDGTVMPPAERSTLYVVRKTPDGLRISSLMPMNPSTKVTCSSFVDG
jgi:hypothetical protein